MADLSQRELARVVGAHQSGISRIESGSDLSLALFEQILATAGLRLAVVDDADTPVEPMAADVLRDAAGRRQPSHLDVHTSPERPLARLHLRSVDPTPRDSWYYRRADRDRLRAAAGAIPHDQPTLRSVAAARHERIAARRERAKALARGPS